MTYYLYYSEDPNFIGSTPIQVAYIESKSIYYVGTGISLLLFGIVFVGGIRIRRKVILLITITMITAMLFVSCGGGGTGSGGGDITTISDEITQGVSGLSINTTYYWKVVADDGNGGVVESDTYSFTTAP